MIFITVGSQKFQFNRLLRKMDELIQGGAVKDEVFAQTGASDYRPVHYPWIDFMNATLYAEMEERADLILTHGGTGAILGGVKKGKKVIAVPRLACYGEHVDDHQIQLLAQFEKMKIICVCWDIDRLGDLLKEIQEIELQPYQSNTAAIISSIETFLSGGQKI